MRNWLWASIIVAIWALAVWNQNGPAARGADAPVGDFSAARAEMTLAGFLGPQRPHPAGSDENKVVHARLLAALAALDVKTAILNTMSCYSEQRWGAIECGEVGDIIAEVSSGPAPQTEQGKAILLMAHLDSVPAGPGAADDGAGVAALLEIIRALKADPGAARHPVLALFTDGEEAGLLGAAAFVADPRWRDRVGVAINFEARGNRGQSFLFQTSPGDGALIDLYARSTARPAASSLYDAIYKFLPNDTDLTPFLKADLTGYNFAFIGDVAQYHTPLDRVENLDTRSLQSQGEAVLGLTRALQGADFAKLKSLDAIYLDVLGRWLPRLGVGWALPLSLLVFLVIALTAWLRHENSPQPWLAALTPPALLLSAVIAGFVLQAIAAAISGHADPAYAQPWLLRLALALAVWAVALMTARFATVASSWLWLAGLGVLAAAWLSGASPYFLFPCLIAAVTLPFTAERRWLLVLPTLAALLIWISLTAQFELLVGLAVTPLFTVPAAIGLIALLPLLKERKGQAVPCGVLALVAAIVAGFLPVYDKAHPQRLNLSYVEEAGKAWWLATTTDGLPAALRAAAIFSASPERHVEQGYAAPAGPPQFVQPTADATRSGNDVTLTLDGAATDGMMLAIPRSAGLQSVTIAGVTTPAPAGAVTFFCATPGCASAKVTLHLAAQSPGDLLLVEEHAGLPTEGAALVKARDVSGVPSQTGDMMILAARIAIPDR